MLIGIISDPHANLPALERVLVDVDHTVCDALLCLGDFVGYGPHPNEVVATLRERCDLHLAGNHDVIAVDKGGISIDAMNPVAAEAIRWTRSEIDENTAAFLASLPSRDRFEGLHLAHASLRDPIWEYVTGPEVAAENFLSESFDVAAVGHTHVPAVFGSDNGAVVGGSVKVAASGVAEVAVTTARVLLNPGGVGQPRDGDPRASWATWDTQSRLFTVHRLTYPVRQVQAEIRRRGLPGFLADRLARGL